MMKGGRRIRLRPLRLAVLCAAGAVSSCGVPPHEGSARHVIEMRAFAFRPDTLRVAAGDTVVWTNRDVVPHTATAGTWDSGSVAAGSRWQMVPANPGTIDYVCTLHPAMTATLIVEDRGDGPSRSAATGG